MDIYSDSSYYETTYSEDERIENALRQKREAARRRAEEKDLNRQEIFNAINSERDLPLFQLPGLKFHTIRHLKIKFSFRPSELTNFVNKKVVFYISVIYKGNYWGIKRDTIPANYKLKIYRLFYDENTLPIDDESIFPVIVKIYEILKGWVKNEEKFRLEKYEKYRNNEDVELDSDDEELFLDLNERVARHQKKLKILRRMIPPKQKRRRI